MRVVGFLLYLVCFRSVLNSKQSSKFLCCTAVVSTILPRNYLPILQFQTCRHLNFYDLLVQKYTFDPETHKMTMVLRYELYNFMFDTARIGHEDTYDMRAILSNYLP